MRCHQCQSEVSSEHLADGAPVSCAVCGAIQSESSATNSEPSRSPQDILARWTDKRFLDPYGPILNRQPMDKRSTVQKLDTAERALPAFGKNTQDPPTPWTSADVLPKPAIPLGAQLEEKIEEKTTEPAVIAETAAVKPTLRLDVASVPTEADTAAIDDADDAYDDDGDFEGYDDVAFEMPGSRGYSIRIDEAHALHSPHVMPQPVEERVGGSWLSVAGQLLAYAGVGGLTFGTILVLIGLHGARPELTPTGWLISTAGQMLLFLGVVTLVSAGMEQTARQVSDQVRQLGDRLIRVESRHSNVRAPNFQQKRVRPADPRAAVAKLRRRVAELERELSDKRK